MYKRQELVAARTFDAAWRATEPVAWHESPFDYVFLDLHLPDGSGLDLLDRMSSLEPRPSVAVISGFLDAYDAIALHGRCVIAVPKPADQNVLFAVLALLEESRSGGSLVGRFAAAIKSRVSCGLSPYSAAKRPTSDPPERDSSSRASTCLLYTSPSPRD